MTKQMLAVAVAALAFSAYGSVAPHKHADLMQAKQKVVTQHEMNVMQQEVRMTDDALFGDKAAQKSLLGLLAPDGQVSPKGSDRLRHLAAEVVGEEAKAAPKSHNLRKDKNAKHHVADVAPLSIKAMGKMPLSTQMHGLEEMLSSLLLSKDGFKATPMEEQTDKIKNLIENEMLPKIQNASDDDQAALNAASTTILTCASTKETEKDSDLVQDHNTQYTASSPEHKACRVTEGELLTEKEDCFTELANKATIRDERCTSYATLSAQLANDELQRDSIVKTVSEDDETYIRRVHSTFCDPSDLDEFIASQTACNDATTDHDNWEAQCNTAQEQYDAKVVTCNNIQKEMDEAACQYASAVKSVCEDYTKCHTDADAAYLALKAEVETREADRVNEWRATKRMQCLIVAFDDGDITDDEITTCKDKTHDTDNLVIDYPDEATHVAAACVIPDLYPYTAEYKLAEFSTLPAQAQGDETANECLAILSVSIIPAEGSPSSCECERVTLTGLYSAGALVKCTGCNDIYKSTDESSCPQGTKLFSPASRTDWETFFASTSAVAEPSFIVDVTRPENANQDAETGEAWAHIGQGICKNHDSDYDGSEGYGDHWGLHGGLGWRLCESNTDEECQAKCDAADDCAMISNSGCCFLFKGEDCDMETAYTGYATWKKNAPYCIKVTTGSEGSNDGTLDVFVDSGAGEVQVATGSHSKEAVVVEKCYGSSYKVRVTNPTNDAWTGAIMGSIDGGSTWTEMTCKDCSAGEGTDNIVVDGNTDGAGQADTDCLAGDSCNMTPYSVHPAMKSSNTEQNTWVTSDGSDWWLSDSTYSEPNGDYTANCYMSLSTAMSGGNMQFDDASCAAHSTSYFCQPNAISLTPKDGSPDGCLCEEVVLTGTYSPGYLLKCSGCTEVSKSLDTDSCPEGTKIFSPRTREDWATVFDSAGPLRGAGGYWIVDITRPSSGTSYTAYAMNSDVAGVTAWKTKDGSPWWLRDSAYSEPNGDYEANCYLDLWAHPAEQDNADNVVFNDWNCKYSSSSYYCQPCEGGDCTR